MDMSIEQFKNSPDPADRVFYKRILETTLKIGRELYRSSDKNGKEELKKICLPISEEFKNYKIYPKL
jgi:hypothetical protein